MRHMFALLDSSVLVVPDLLMFSEGRMSEQTSAVKKENPHCG